MKNFSRRELYALGEPLGESVTRNEAGRRIYGGGGGFNALSTPVSAAMNAASQGMGATSPTASSLFSSAFGAASPTMAAKANMPAAQPSPLGNIPGPAPSGIVQETLSFDPATGRIVDTASPMMGSLAQPAATLPPPKPAVQQPSPFTQATSTPPPAPSQLPQTQADTQQGIADWAQPYLNTMLGATQQQLFNYDPYGNVTGMQGYNPYSYNPADYFAGFTPLQQQAQQGISSLVSPWQTQAASGSLMDLIGRASNLQYQPTSAYVDQVYAPGAQAAQLGNAPTAQATTTQAAQLGAAPTVAAAQMQGPQGIGYQNVAANTVNAPSLRDLQMQAAGNVSAPGMTADLMQAAQTGFNPNLNTFQMGPAQQVGTQDYTGSNVNKYMDPYMQQVVGTQQREAKRQSDILAAQQGAQAAQAGAFGGSRRSILEAERQRNLATQLGNIQATGSQAAFQNAQQQFNTQQQAALQAQLANQQAGLTTGQQNLAAQLGVQQLGTQTGMQTALANLNNQQQAAVQNQAARLQASGMNAQQAMQAALANQQNQQQANLQNLSAGLQTQGLQAQTGLQAQQLNQSAGLQAALANQQAGLTSGQFNAQQAYNTALQNAQMQQQANLANQGLLGQFGLQQGQFGQAANLANQQAMNQFALANQGLAGQYGLQQGQFGQAANMLNAQQGLQAQLANQQAQQAANQLMSQQNQFGSNLGLQGLQAAMSGAGQLGGLGSSGLQNQLALLNAQQATGLTQQQQQQQIINQAVQNYQTAQQYPYQQLGFMRNMVSGLPYSTSSTQNYSQAPSMAQNLSALGMGAYGLNQLMGGGSPAAAGTAAGGGGGGVGGLTGALNTIGGLGTSAINGIGQAGSWLNQNVFNGFFADGGQVRGYADGGSVESPGNVANIVDGLSDQQLQQAMKAAQARGDMDQLQAVQNELAMRASERGGLAGAFNQLPAPAKTSMANGGIVAFNGEDEEQLVDGSTAPLSAIDAQVARLQGMQYKPYTRTTAQHMEDIRSLLGDSPYAGMREQIDAAHAKNADQLERGKGLAALAAMQGMLEPGGFVRGLGKAGGAFAQTYGQAMDANQKQQDALMRMNINLADAERKEKMGLVRDAITDRRQAEQENNAANMYGLKKNEALGKLEVEKLKAQRGPKPTSDQAAVAAYAAQLKAKNPNLPPEQAEAMAWDQVFKRKQEASVLAVMGANQRGAAALTSHELQTYAAEATKVNGEIDKDIRNASLGIPVAGLDLSKAKTEGEKQALINTYRQREFNNRMSNNPLHQKAAGAKAPEVIKLD
jgi:hypothetical protein